MRYLLYFVEVKQLIIILLLSFQGLTQGVDCGELMGHFNFEVMPDTNYFIVIDTISNPNNIWQIGESQKSVVNGAVSSPNIIITDTINPYAINDTSSFIIKFPDMGGYSDFGTIEIEGYYNVQSDNPNDFGMIEVSLDNGVTWIDAIQSGWVNWAFGPPMLSGNSNGWQYFYGDASTLASFFNGSTGDTIKWKFSYLTDGIQDSLDGLAFDDLRFCNWAIGLEELSKTSNSLTKIVDLMGRESEDLPNQLLIFIYSDGTTEKVFRVE